MKKNIDHLISVLKSLIGFFDIHKSVTDPIVQIKEIATELPTHYSTIIDNAKIQQESSEGLTREKAIITDVLCHTLYPIMTLICNEAYKQKDIELSTRMKTSSRKLKAMKESNLIATSKDVCEYCDTHTEELAGIGIQATSVEKLKSDTIELENIMGKPRELRSCKKTATENMNEEATKTNWLIQNRLSPLMHTFFAENNPSLLSEYQGIVQYDKIPRRKVCLIGIITDTDTGEPIEKVLVEIPSANVSYRTNSKYGRFQIKNMEEGNFTIRCTQANYHPKVMEFSHAWGLTTHLSIKMEMTDIAKQQNPKAGILQEA